MKKELEKELEKYFKIAYYTTYPQTTEDSKPYYYEDRKEVNDND